MADLKQTLLLVPVKHGAHIPSEAVCQLVQDQINGLSGCLDIGDIKAAAPYRMSEMEWNRQVDAAVSRFKMYMKQALCHQEEHRGGYLDMAQSALDHLGMLRREGFRTNSR